MCSRRVLEFEDIKPRRKFTYLTWSEWSNASLLSYLNLIDFSKKKATTDVVPWVDVPAYEEDVLRFCKSAIFNLYKPHVMNKLATEDSSSISDCIVKFIRVCDIYDVFRDEDERSQLYSDTLNCLFDRGCKDSALMRMLWDRVCGKSERSRAAVFESLIGKYQKKKSAKILLYVLKIAQAIRYDFWGAWVKGHSLKTFHFCPVTAALLNGNVEQMTVLLQYGFQQNCQRVCTYDKYFQVFINPAYSWLRVPLVEETTPKRRKFLTEILLFLDQMSTCAASSRRRSSSLLRCFRLLWDTIPEPFVTGKELLGEVELRFRNPPADNPPPPLNINRCKFLLLCRLYDELNSGEWAWTRDMDTTSLQPRSLQHLSKCCIRDLLQGTMSLPSGIDQLPIPNSMKLYLNVTWST